MSPTKMNADQPYPTAWDVLRPPLVDQPPLIFGVTEADSRDRAIRAVVAAQWATACALFTCGGGPATFDDIRDMEAERDPPDFDDWTACITDVAALPTPEQIVDGVV